MLIARVPETNGVTSLWIASENGALDVMTLLLEKNADVETPGMSYYTEAVWCLLVEFQVKGETPVSALLLGTATATLWSVCWRKKRTSKPLVRQIMLAAAFVRLLCECQTKTVQPASS